ncbi:MAG TPA: PQQ-binding-like beta-propeller repeat protein [Verrucomicrobiae bacterium]
MSIANPPVPHPISQSSPIPTLAINLKKMILIRHIHPSRLQHALYLTTFLILVPYTHSMGWREIPLEPGLNKGLPNFVFDSAGDLFLSQSSNTNRLLRKISGATGGTKWERLLPSSGPVIAVSDSGTLACLRSDVSIPSKTNLFVTLLSASTGSNLWETVVTNVTIPAFEWVAFDPQGNVAAMSFAYGTNGVATILKLDKATGNIRWRTVVEMNYAGRAYLNVDHQGNAIVSTQWEFSQPPEWNFRAVKFDATDGRVLWDWKDITNRASILMRPTTDNNGDVILTGECSPFALYTAKIKSEDGSLAWCNARTTREAIGYYSITVTSHDVITVGKSQDAVTSETTTYVTRCAAESGATIWERTLQIGGERPGSIQPVCLIRDVDGQILLGTSEIVPAHYPNDLRQKIRKLNAETGSTIWEVAREYNRHILNVLGSTHGRFAHWSWNENTDYMLGLSHIGPELTTRPFPNHLEISWEPENLGYTLQQSTNNSEPLNWLPIQGSTTTNLLRLPKTESPVFFRLVRE